MLVSMIGFYAAYAVLALVMLFALWLHDKATPLLAGIVTLFLTVAIAIPSLALWWLRHRGSQPLLRSTAFIALMSASIAMTLVPIPLGLGSFEASCAGMLALLGVRIEPAVTATLLLRGMTLWLPLALGLILVRSGSRRSS